MFLEIQIKVSMAKFDFEFGSRGNTKVSKDSLEMMFHLIHKNDKILQIAQNLDILEVTAPHKIRQCDIRFASTNERCDRTRKNRASTN